MKFSSPWNNSNIRSEQRYEERTESRHKFMETFCWAFIHCNTTGIHSISASCVSYLYCNPIITSYYTFPLSNAWADKRAGGMQFLVASLVAFFFFLPCAFYWNWAHAAYRGNRIFPPRILLFRGKNIGMRFKSGIAPAGLSRPIRRARAIRNSRFVDARLEFARSKVQFLVY